LRIRVRTRSAGGVLGSTQTLSASGASARDPDIAVDPNGNAVVVWQRSDGTHYRIQSRVRSATGTLSPIQTLSDAGQHAAYPEVGIDQGGNAVVVWQRSGVIETRARSAGGVLSAIQTLSDAAQAAQEPHVAVNPSGAAIFVWMRYGGGTGCGGFPGCLFIQARARSTAGTLSAVQTLSQSGQHSDTPRVGMDPNGNAVFVWRRTDETTDCLNNSGCLRIQTRARSEAGVLSAVQTLSGPGYHTVSPSVGVDANGNAVSVWLGTMNVEARTRSAAGDLGDLQALGPGYDNPAVAVDPTGDAVATWRRWNGGNDYVIQAATGP
jgi:hypothetical protein